MKTYFVCSPGEKCYFTSEFDGGNMDRCEQINPYNYRLHPRLDSPEGGTIKSFFNFRVYGFKGCRVRFHITRLNLLDIKPDNYRPVFSRDGIHFAKVPNQARVFYGLGEPQVSFQFYFEDEHFVQFSFSFPYPYERCLQFLEELQQSVSKYKSIYFHQEVLCHSQEGRDVHLLTLTASQNILHEREAQSEFEKLFPFKGLRPFKTRQIPLVLVTARIHPGEAPSSYCMEGVLKMLTTIDDPRAVLLRRHFVFLIIPMLNPDGVFHGRYRTDLNNANLNRMYLTCDPSKHPTIYWVRNWLDSIWQVSFYFDLHAHPSKKDFFIYGNAFDQFCHQIEAQLFSRLLEVNCSLFEDLDCVYSVRPMASKDKNDGQSKEGCGRVYLHRTYNIIHSYTVECGYFGPLLLNSDSVAKQNRQRIVSSVKQAALCFNGQYSPGSYMYMGRCLISTILDIFDINMPPCLLRQEIDSLRRQIAHKLYQQADRFRLTDGSCHKKIKQVAEIIRQIYYVPHFGQTFEDIRNNTKEGKSGSQSNSSLSQFKSNINHSNSQGRKMRIQTLRVQPLQLEMDKKLLVASIREKKSFKQVTNGQRRQKLQPIQVVQAGKSTRSYSEQRLQFKSTQAYRLQVMPDRKGIGLLTISRFPQIALVRQRGSQLRTTTIGRSSMVSQSRGPLVGGNIEGSKPAGESIESILSEYSQNNNYVSQMGHEDLLQPASQSPPLEMLQDALLSSNRHMVASNQNNNQTANSNNTKLKLERLNHFLRRQNGRGINLRGGSHTNTPIPHNMPRGLQANPLVIKLASMSSQTLTFLLK